MPKLKGKKHVSNILTDFSVKAFKGPGRLNDGDGLSLVVTTAGYRRWIYRYSFAGKQRDLFIGTSSKISLKKARSEREKAKEHLLDGINPSSIMNARAKKIIQTVAAGIPTFSHFAKQYIDELTTSLKNKKSRQPWDLAINVYCKKIGELRLNAIAVDDVASVLRPIWATKYQTAKKVRWRIEAIFAAAIVKGYREKNLLGEIIQRQNPAKLELIEQLPGFKKRNNETTTKHLAAMPYQQTPGFMRELSTATGASARALELAILTACRTANVIGARWDEFDLKKAIWTIPAERMKMGREHIVPLAPSVVALLSSVDRFGASPFVFFGTKASKHISNMAMLKRLQRMERGDVTTHGFRTAFRTWAAECTEFPSEIAEHALAHQVGSNVERAYNRTTLLEKRRKLMDAWATFCQSSI
jgi:integrase